VLFLFPKKEEIHLFELHVAKTIVLVRAQYSFNDSKTKIKPVTLQNLNFYPMRILILALFWPFYVFATGIQFFEGTWAEALDKASKENKPIFLDAYAEWCGPCKLMARSVFPDASVGEFYNEHFVNMKIDMEKGEGPGLRAQYKVSAYPTLLFVQPTGEVIQKKVGAIDAKNFLALGKQIMKSVDKSEEYAKIYESGERNPDFILK